MRSAADEQPTSPGPGHDGREADMGLMDKVKAQATQVAAKAQEAGKVGQAKLEAVQARRKADGLLGELGKITFDAKTGRCAAGDDKRAADLVEQLRQYEAEYGLIGDDADNGAASGPDGTGDGGFPSASPGRGDL